MTRLEKVKRFFGVPDKPVTNSEMLKFKKEDPEGFEEVASAVEAHYAAEAQ